MLEGIVDIYLMDFKYLDGEKAKEYSCAHDYPPVAKEAISECYRQQPRCILKDGILQKGVIVRHLVLPQNTKTAMEVFDWVRENTPNVYFSLMSQYLPFHKALDHKVLNRKITNREYEKVVDYVCSFDFPNVFIQEKESSNEKFIPSFDLEGV